MTASPVDDLQIAHYVKTGQAGLIPWALTYLGHLLPIESAEFHWEIAELAERHDRLAIAAPRGHAKSTWLALAYPLYRAACFGERFILIVSDTGPQAEQRTSDLYSELLENTRLVSDYPHLALPERSDYATKRVKKSTKEFITIGGIRFASAGAGQSLRGMREREHRPTLVIVDDLENDDNVLTEYQREKLWDWFTKALMNLPGPTGSRIIVIGTILHQESLLARLIKPEKADVWQQRLYRAIKEDGEPLWPTAWSHETLKRKKTEIGSRAFSSEYMNEPFDDESAMFKRAWFDANRRLEAPDLISIAIAVDPSASKDGDACGIVAGGVDSEFHGYVLGDYTLQGSPREWARVVLEAFWQLEANEIIAEKNNGGEMILSTLESVLEPGEYLPPTRLVWASRGKQIRAEPVAALAEAGKIHHVGHFDALEKEMTTWRPGLASPNRLDAWVWLFSGLILDSGQAAFEAFTV